jgi:hypothetical protein
LSFFLINIFPFFPAPIGYSRQGKGSNNKEFSPWFFYPEFTQNGNVKIRISPFVMSLNSSLSSIRNSFKIKHSIAKIIIYNPLFCYHVWSLTF